MRQWEKEIKAFKEQQERQGYDERKLEETVRNSQYAYAEWGQENGRSRKSIGRLAAVAAAALVLIPGTAIAAAKWYQMSVEQEGYQVEIQVTKENDSLAGAEDEVRYYRVFWDYLPEGYSYQHGKFMMDDFTGGISPLIYALGDEGSSYSLRDVAGIEEFELDGRQGYLLQNASVINLADEDAYDRSLFFVFEEENFMARLYVSRSVSDEELRKVAEGLRLEPVTAEEWDEFGAGFERMYVSTEFTWTDMEIAEQEAQAEAEARASEFTWDPEVSLAQVLNLHEPFTYYVDTDLSGVLPALAERRMTLESVEVLDNISALNTANIVDYDEVWWDKTFGEGGAILPEHREVYAYGDGVNEPARTFVEEKEVERSMLLVHLTVENASDQNIELFIGSRMLHIVNGVIQDKEGVPVLTKRQLPEIMEAIYVQVSGEGAPVGYAHYWDMPAGAVQEITLGYLVDKDTLDTLCLEKSAVIVPGEAPVTVALPIGANVLQ